MSRVECVGCSPPVVNACLAVSSCWRLVHVSTCQYIYIYIYIVCYFPMRQLYDNFIVVLKKLAHIRINCVGGLPPWNTIVGGIPPCQHEWVGGVPPWKTIVGGIPPEHYLVVFVLCSSLLLSFMISSMLFPSTLLAHCGSGCQHASGGVWSGGRVGNPP